jgi:hypothetical protein
LNLDFLDPESSVLPITPPGNGKNANFGIAKDGKRDFFQKCCNHFVAAGIQLYGIVSIVATDVRIGEVHSSGVFIYSLLRDSGMGECPRQSSDEYNRTVPDVRPFANARYH